jgi:hypothetical protein
MSTVIEHDTTDATRFSLHRPFQVTLPAHIQAGLTLLLGYRDEFLFGKCPFL